VINNFLKRIFATKERPVFNEKIHKRCEECTGSGLDFVAGPCIDCDGNGFVDKTRKEKWHDKF
jgi:DnaJ-class molecular chaperone